MNKNKVKQKKKEKINTKKLVIIFVCAFLAAVLVFGITLGVILAVRNSRAVVRYKSVSMDGEVLSFFETYYKYQYKTMLTNSGVKNVDDTEEFWNTVSDSGKTYGELLKEGAKEYVSAVLAANHIFNSYSSLSSADKEKIADAARKTLEYKAESDKKLFDSGAEKYGFDYDSYKDAVKMLYKATYAQSAVYGADGSNLQGYPELAGEYLSEYSHVKLLIIRTETTFALDAAGNRLPSNDGGDALRDLTESEKAERAELISEIRGYIDAIGNGGVEMGALMFEEYLEEHDEGDAEKHTDGYYFHKNSSYTAEFSEELGRIVEKAYQMKLDSFDEVTLDFGVCFIYKYQPTDNAYKMNVNEDCFADFYINAANSIFESQLEELIGEVTFTDKYDPNSIITKPYNYIYTPIF